MKKSLNERKKITVDWKLLIPSLVVLALLLTPLVLFEEKSMAFLDDVYVVMANNLSWFFILSINIFVVFGFYMIFSKYGNIVLGDPKDKPKMNLFTYASIIIGTALSATIIRTGSGQWAKWVSAPPFGIEPGSAEAITQANAYGISFWGFQYMAVCAVVVPALAYMLHVRKRKRLRISEMFRVIFGDKYADGILGRITDVFFIISLTAGNAVVLGLGAPIATTSIAKLFNIEPNFTLTLVVTVFWVFLFTASVYRGLEKGIALLSVVNMRLAIGIGVFIFIVGPTAFIMTYFTETIGIFISQQIDMMFYTDSIGSAINGAIDEAADWSFFWWAYAASASLIYSIFIASISKGRTIKEVMAVFFLTPLITSFASHAVLGGTAIHQWLTGAADHMATYEASGTVAIIPEMITTLPWGNILLVFVILSIIIFLTTTLDSVCYSMASYTEKLDMSKDEPSRFSRILWALVVATVALLLMNIGGLPPLEIAVVATGSVMLIIEFLMVYAGFKMFNEDKAWIHNVREPKNKK